MALSPDHRARGPRYCLEARPTHQSISFGGRFINLQKLADLGGLDHGYLSRIFAGERTASVEYLERICDCLGMTLDDFRACIKERQSDLKEKMYEIPTTPDPPAV